ncbi:NADAR family protein, partial [Listeria monocytogenes]|nr:NADAR family protein [Listeria monocytogenes]
PSDSLDLKNPLEGQGQNLLGLALIEVRDELHRV